MNIEFIGEDIFFKAITTSGYVWVAMHDNTALTFSTNEDMLALPIWHSKADAYEFLENTEQNNFIKPVEVPLDIFKQAWLSNINMKISDLVINPNGLLKKDLTVTKKEFINSLLARS